MSEYKSEFLKTLQTRGFIKQVTHEAELDAYCQAGVPIAYIGFDATADSLHVGSLLQIMMLRHLQKAGGKPIVLMGGGTTKVGDPTDKEKSRPLLTNEQIEANIAGIKKAFEPFLTFGDGPTDAIMVNNDDWLGKLGYIELLREVGVHFTINTMVKQDTVARRLAAEQPYTFLEFNYLLMQSYDFLELFRRHKCRIQLGGSDQWGNIVGEDADVGRFLRLFTELPLEEIEALEKLEGAEINKAKIALANAATTMLHGEAAAKESEAAASAVFAGGGTAAALPTVEIPSAELFSDYLVAAAFTAAGLTESNGEARRLIKQGAAKVNDQQVKDQNATLVESDVVGGSIKLSAGKKRHALVKPV